MNTFFSVIGILIILYVFYQVLNEVRDHYETFEQDQYVLSLIDDIRQIDPSVDEIVDRLRFFEGDKSYTIDKRYVYICKKDKKTSEQYHRNQLTLVLIHEISHALCDEVGHTDKFNDIFEYLLAKAENTVFRKDGKEYLVHDPRIPSVDGYCEW